MLRIMYRWFLTSVLGVHVHDFTAWKHVMLCVRDECFSVRVISRLSERQCLKCKLIEDKTQELHRSHTSWENEKLAFDRVLSELRDKFEIEQLTGSM